MAALALFQPDARSRARLSDALREYHELTFCQSWTDLWDTMVDGRLDGCIVDPHNSFDPVSLPEILHFRRRFPSTALIVSGEFTGRELDLYYLGRMGVDGVILAGADHDHRQLRGRVEMALSSWLAKRVADALEGILPPLGIRCVRWAIAHAEECPQVPDLVRAMRLSPRALSRELRSRGLPSPRHLLLWGRLFQAARMLEGSDVTVEEVAFRLGYATAASLGRAFRDRLDLSPSDLRHDQRSLRRVMDAFVHSLEEREDLSRRWSSPDTRQAVMESFALRR
ncbi:MAG: helix-turn-helix domain-containing protein [Longimicrobiales bacterium]